MVAVVVVIVDVDDEEGEGRGEDAQRRKSNNPNLVGFLSCMNLYHIHSVRMECFARCMFFGIHIALSANPDLLRCTSETIVTSADAARRRAVSFVRMMHHCIMAPGLGPKVRPADRPQGRRHWGRQDAARPQPMSFLRIMHPCIMEPGFGPKVRPANRPLGRRHDRQRNWFPIYAILAV